MEGQTSLNQKSLLPRENLRRTLKYRPHLKWTYYFLLIVSALLWLPVLVAAVQKILAASYLQGFNILFFASIGPAFIWMQARFILKPLAFSTIDVFPDRLEIDRMGKKRVMPFEAISQIKFSFIRNTGGWFRIILKDKSSYRFTVVLERGEYILEAISAYRPSLVPIKDLETYRRTTIISDHTWAHMYGKLENKKALLLKFVAEPIGAAFLLVVLAKFMGNNVNARSFFVLAIIFCIGQAAISFLAWWITSIILTLKTRSNLIKDPNSVSRDMVFEKRMDSKSRLVQRILTSLIILGLALRIIFK